MQRPRCSCRSCGPRPPESAGRSGSPRRPSRPPCGHAAMRAPPAAAASGVGKATPAVGRRSRRAATPERRPPAQARWQPPLRGRRTMFCAMQRAPRSLFCQRHEKIGWNAHRTRFYALWAKRENFGLYPDTIPVSVGSCLVCSQCVRPNGGRTSSCVLVGWEGRASPLVWCGQTSDHGRG